jgi:hypothetical protein
MRKKGFVILLLLTKGENWGVINEKRGEEHEERERKNFLPKFKA